MIAAAQSEPSAFASCANFLARAIFASLDETLGKTFYANLLRESGLEQVALSALSDEVGKSFPLSRLSRLFVALEKMEGTTAQRGLLQRSGRAWFLNLQRRSSPSLGIFTAQVLTLPKTLKIKRSGEILAEYFHRYMDIEFSVQASPTGIRWGFGLPHAQQNSLLGSGLADLWVGFWSEFLYTLSGGKHHLIHLNSEVQLEKQAWVIDIPYLPFEG
ncbi:MAG: hypothetical protein DDG59_13445 [Anaerolineae bacterium]|jgi:hypothetical protein|nr:MAG: hypothetical protein DDG59_13445 [Anaerolineae bacterium]